MEDLAAALALPFCGIWLDALSDIPESRFKKRTGDASDANLGVLARQFVSDIGPMTWRVVDSGQPAEQVALASMAGLKRFSGKVG